MTKRVKMVKAIRARERADSGATECWSSKKQSTWECCK